MMTSTRVDELRMRIEALRRQEDALAEELAEAQADDWEARLEDLNVQAHLAVMEVRERLTPILDSLSDRILEVRADLLGADGTTVAEVAEALRHGFGTALRDLNAAAHEASAALARAGQRDR